MMEILSQLKLRVENFYFDLFFVELKMQINIIAVNLFIYIYNRSNLYSKP